MTYGSWWFGKAVVSIHGSLSYAMIRVKDKEKIKAIDMPLTLKLHLDFFPRVGLLSILYILENMHHQGDTSMIVYSR